MEVDDLAGADTIEGHATVDDLLFGEDGDAAEYTTGEVDELLGEDDYTGDGDLIVGGEEEEEGDGDGDGEESAENTSMAMRGRGSFRPMFRGMRGGRFMMRGMMMGPPRFFPPMHLPPGMRPPFPHFMGPGRPPFAMRGMRPMRLPVPPPPVLMRMAAMNRARFAMLSGMRGRGMSHESKPPPVSQSSQEEKSDGAPTKPEGPIPLMSIQTPTPPDIRGMARGPPGGHMNRGSGHRFNAPQRGGGSNYQSNSRGGNSTSLGHHQRGTSSGNQRPVKRHAQTHGHHPMQTEQGEPRAKLPHMMTRPPTSSRFVRPTEHMQTSSQTAPTYFQRHSQPRVTTPAPTQSYAYGGNANGYQPRPPPQKFVVSHKPAPNLTQIPLSQAEPQPAVKGVKVMILNLPPTANFAEVSAMTNSCGSVQTLNMRKENNSATIEFTNPASADHFTRLYNNTVMGSSQLNVIKI